MKLANIALTTVLLSTATLGFSATLSGSSNITFLSLDGERIQKHTPPFQLSDHPVHQAVIEVSAIYQSGSDQHFFNSEPIVVTFPSRDEDVVLSVANLRSAYEVDMFKKSPLVKITTVSGKAIEAKQAVLKGDGFMPNANIRENIARYNAGNHIASVPRFSANTASAVALKPNTAPQGKVTVQGENIAEQQLQYWFQQADKATQKRFLAWAKKQ